MSIIGKNGEEAIHMPGFWETMMKIAIMLAVPVFTLGMGWAVWITTTTFQHAQEIAVIHERLGDIQSRIHGVSSQIGKIPNKVATAIKAENDD